MKSSDEIDQSYKLLKKVLQKKQKGVWVRIGSAHVKTFGLVTHNTQYIHTSKSKAFRGPYKKLVGHAYYTLSLIPYLTSKMPFAYSALPGHPTVLNYGSNKVRFPKEVYIGAHIRATRVIIKIQKRLNTIIVWQCVTIRIQGEKKPACVAESVVCLWWH